jgi:uncharacterized protein
MAHSLQPPSERIHIIDALRGFTLLGIIMAHMVEQYYAGVPPETHANETTAHVWDMIVAGLVGLAITGKFFMIFSFLFGMSFSIQLSKGNGDLPFVARFFWRLLLLYGIGMVHHLHYRGDILTIYAMLGIVLLLTFKLPERIILWLGILLVIDMPGIITRIVQLIIGVDSMGDFMQQDQAELQRYYDTFTSGAYADLLRLNYESFATKMDYQVWSGRLYITMGLFLLGYYAGMKRLFQDMDYTMSLVKKYLPMAGWGLLGVVLFGAAFFIIGNSSVPGGMSQNINVAVGLSFMDLFNALLAVIYLSWFVLAFRKEKWHRRLMVFYEPGRMGLTTYLMQSVFGLLLLSTLGLGLYGEMGAATLFLISIAVFTVQILISRFWLKYFNNGPVEWLWRSLTRLRWEPLLRKPVSVGVVPEEIQESKP